MSCTRTQHNVPGQGSNPERSLRVERANREATAPPTRKFVSYLTLICPTNNPPFHSQWQIQTFNLPSFISSFPTQNKGEGPPDPPIDPPLIVQAVVMRKRTISAAILISAAWSPTTLLSLLTDEWMKHSTDDFVQKSCQLLWPKS